MLAGRAEASGTTVDEETEKALDNQAIRQFIDPGDIAQLALFLAGPNARTITGQMFPIDGGAQHM